MDHASLRFVCIFVVYYQIYSFKVCLILPTYRATNTIDLLLHMFNEGLPPNPVFQNSVFGECSIIIGGEFNEESKMQVFGDALLETVRVTHSPKG